MIKFYTEPKHYQGSEYRRYLSHFLRPYIKDSTISKNELVNLYGDYVNSYEMVIDIQESDFVILPMTIEYYLQYHKQQLMLKFIENAKLNGKIVITETYGDFGVTPLVKDIIVLRQNGYQSRRLQKQWAMPVYFRDPLKVYYKKEEIFIRDKTDKPVIGFCGQSRTTIKKNIYDVTRTFFRNLKYYLRLSIWEPHNLYPSTLLRSKVLKMVEKDVRLDANFIKRDKYRAGASLEGERLKTTIEFFDNIIESDYIICVRGGGNFSVRIFETLAMGRIPIFINTDSILPYDNIIDWKKYCIWIEKNQIQKIGDIVIDFHNSLTNSDFHEMQLTCRMLWEKHLSLNGAMKSLNSLFYN